MINIPRKRKRGRPKKIHKSSDFIELDVNKKLPDSTDPNEIERLKNELQTLKEQLLVLTKKEVEKEEQTVTLDIQKLENESLLSYSQRQKIQQKIQMYERLLNERETKLGNAYGTEGGKTECFVKNQDLDKNELHFNLMQAKRTLDRGTMGKLSQKDIDRLIKEKYEIEEILKETLPSLSDQNSSDSRKIDEIAYYMLEHQKKYGHLMKKLQNINKTLEPNNPNAGNLRYLYKK